MLVCSDRTVTNLDAVLEEVARRGEALLFVQGLTEYNNLLEQEDPPFFHSGQESPILV